MKRVLFPLILLSLLATLNLSSSAQSQTRPRRVGSASSAPQTSTPPTAPIEAPKQVPVLRGNTRSPGQPATPPPQRDQGPEEVSEGDIIRVNTTLVTIPVSVSDRDGRYIPNLDKRDFRLWEDEIEQQVAYFQSVDKPFSVILMIDTSASTRFRLEDIQDAAITFVSQLRPDDQVMVVSFDDDVRILTEFTLNRQQIQRAILRTRTAEGTRLYDAMDLVINQRLNRISGRKAIVLFTDGVDTTSRHSSYEENITDAEELDALVYPVQYDTYSDMGGGRGGGWPTGPRFPSSTADILAQILGGMGRGGVYRRGGRGTSRRDYDLANRYLMDLADKTGARHHRAETIQNLAAAFSNIAEELRRQYSLGYYPKRPAQAGERRQIRVRVNQPNLSVRSRESYVFNPKGGTAPDVASQQSAPVLKRKFAGDSDDYAKPMNR